MKKDCIEHSPEAQIKALVLEHLNQTKALTKQDVIISELFIDNYSRRADLVVSKMDKLFAYEIKSEADSLHRLNAQIEKYVESFDKTVVVAHQSHINKILKMLPTEVGVWQVTDEKIEILRDGKLRSRQDKKNFLQFMRAQEVKAFLRKENVAFKNQNRKSLEDLAIKFSLKKLRAVSVETLRRRYRPSTEKFWTSVTAAKTITASDVAELSLYLEKRKINRSVEIKQSLFWTEWKKDLNCESDDPLLLKLRKNSGAPIFGCIPANLVDVLST